MTDAQHLFDFARRQINDIANDVERHFDLVAGQLREWIPANAPFARPPPAPKRLPPATTLQLATRWISRHRALSAAILAFTLTGSVGAAVYISSSQQQYRRGRNRRRRGAKSASGARTDVVIVAGSGAAVAHPLTSAVYLDLERKGFVVYVVATSAEDAAYIRSQSRADLLPLLLDPTDPLQAAQQMERFADLLRREHRVFEDVEPHRLRLRGLVVVPDTAGHGDGAEAEAEADDGDDKEAGDLSYADDYTGWKGRRIDSITAEAWSDALNAKLLNTIATTQLLLPAVVEHSARVLLLAPAVSPSLRPPGRAVENTVHAALEAFFATLAAETSGSGVAVSHFKLGDIDIPAVTAARLRREGGAGAASTSTPSSSSPSSSSSLSFSALTSTTLGLGARLGLGLGLGQGGGGATGTPVRRLHDAVFDALTSSRPPARTRHIGRGSLTYDLIASYLPAALVGRMMGWSRRRRPVVRTAELGHEATVVDEPLHASAGSLTWEKVDEAEV